MIVNVYIRKNGYNKANFMGIWIELVLFLRFATFSHMGANWKKKLNFALSIFVVYYLQYQWGKNCNFSFQNLTNYLIETISSEIIVCVLAISNKQMNSKQGCM